MNTCFQMNLPENYSQIIKKWRETWTSLREHVLISETNKIHTINCHLEDYYDATKFSISRSSDQWVESSHHALQQTLIFHGCIAKIIESEVYGEKLFKTVNIYFT